MSSDYSDEKEEFLQSNPSTFGKKDAIIFVVDVNPSMFTNTQESPYKTSLKCVVNAMKNKAISSVSDLTAIYLQGTAKTQNIMNFPKISCFQELTKVTAPRVLEAQKLLNLDYEQFVNKFGGKSTNSDISDTLFLCLQSFGDLTVKVDSKRVFIFTNEHKIVATDSKNIKLAEIRARDLINSNVELILVPFDGPFGQFDPSICFQSIIPTLDPKTLRQDTESYIRQLQTRVFCRDRTKSLISRPILTIGGLKIAISLHKLVQKSARPAVRRVDRSSGHLLRSSTTYCDYDSNEVTGDITRHLIFFGGDYCVFSPDELRDMHSRGDPTELRVVGFTDRDWLKPFHHVTCSYFVSGLVISGEDSLDLFRLLLKQCVGRNKLILCWYVPRNGSTGRYVILQPQEEEIDDNTRQQIFPSGFYMITLPYSDDIRHVGKLIDQNSLGVPDELVDTTKELIDRLMFTYRPEAFENPAVRRFYGTLEAMALDMDDVDDFEDMTLPNNEAIERRGGEVIKRFLDLCGQDSDYSEKMIKKDKNDFDSPLKCGGNMGFGVPSVEEMREIVSCGRTGALTVPCLKSFLCDNQVVCSPRRMLKNDLIRVVSDFCIKKEL